MSAGIVPKDRLKERLAEVYLPSGLAACDPVLQVSARLMLLIARSRVMDAGSRSGGCTGGVASSGGAVP